MGEVSAKDSSMDVTEMLNQFVIDAAMRNVSFRQFL